MKHCSLNHKATIYDSPHQFGVWNIRDVASTAIVDQCQVLPRHLSDDGLPDDERPRDAQPVREERDWGHVHMMSANLGCENS